MNKLSKPISSPGRTDKFPPPLMRFLRSNVGSKSSRRRSRASPMFVRKKNTLTETTQEPSSPKVTCIGQVRVRRSNNKKNNKTTVATPSLHPHHPRGNRLCRCLRSISFKPLFRTVWTRCFSFLQSRSCCCWSCYCCNNPSNNNSGDLHVSLSAPVVTETVIEAVTTGDDSEAGKGEQQEDENEILQKADNNVNEATPKNALLLTRCRSAPYRASSLASIFRESTILEKTSEEEEEIVKEKVEDLNIEKEDESNECEESKAVPLILSRCKSAPARRWDQLLLVSGL